MPATVDGVFAGTDGVIDIVPVPVKDAEGYLVPSAVPKVTIAKYARYLEDGPRGAADDDVEVLARIAENLATHPLAGFVGEGASPYGSMNPSTDDALRVAAFSGMPVVRCGRANTGGVASKTDPFMVAGNNLTATKARLLLMACLLRFGALPPARDPRNPTEEEAAAIAKRVAELQEIFDTH
jgi:hypothetical protein